MSSHVDPGHTVGFALKRLQQALRARMDGALASFGLTAPQYAVLALLAEEPGISNAELARRSFVTAPTMIRIVTALEEAGLITRTDPTTGRAKTTTLTPKGQTHLSAAATHVQHLEDILRTNAGDHAELVLSWLNACAVDLETP
ncbi:MarR family transcriptional regulator [Actinocrispum sp. NPDC049592]|uniref:MarR family winged helix-turn-helix transcriptional regulator n=1 Tax=Actinocrispum sp. NPDC049592 TaxID=3154835 RepID=UPI00342B641C